MSQRTEQLAELYKNFVKTAVFTQLDSSLKAEAELRRRNASKLEPVQSWGELRFADGVEWVLTHIKSQQSLDKKGAREK